MKYLGEVSEIGSILLYLFDIHIYSGAPADVVVEKEVMRGWEVGNFASPHLQSRFPPAYSRVSISYCDSEHICVQQKHLKIF